MKKKYYTGIIILPHLPRCTSFFVALCLFCFNALFSAAQNFDWVKPEASGATTISIIATTVDDNGNSYSLIQFEGTIVIDGNSISPIAGYVSNLIVKYDPSGVYQWAVPFGDTSGYLSYNIKADNNKVLVFYETNMSPTFFPDTIVQAVSFAQVAVLDVDGSFVKIIPAGTDCYHSFDQIMDAENGNIYYASCNGYRQEIRKIDSLGNDISICTIFDSLPGSSANIYEIKCTPDGKLLVFGEFHGTIKAGSTVLDAYPCCNGYSSFIFKLNETGFVIWGQKCTWNFTDFAIAGDANGNSYLGSDIRSPEFQFGNQAFPYNSINESILIKLDSSGTLIWHQEYFSTANSAYTASCRINEIYANNLEEVLVLGNFWGIGITPFADYVPRPDQYYLLKFNENGTKIWFTDFNDMPPFPGMPPHIATSDGIHFNIIGEMVPGNSHFGCQTAGSNYEDFFIAAFTDTASLAPVTNFQVDLNNSVAYFNNQSSNYDSLRWSFGDSSFSNQINPSHIYSSAGVYNVALAAFNSCGTGYANTQVTIEGVAHITPAYAGNQGYLVTLVYGAGFKPGTSIVLSKAGLNDIIPDTVIFIDSTRLQVNFNFHNEQTGVRDITASIPGTGTFVKTGGFEIQTLKEFNPYISFSGNYVTRLDNWRLYEVKVGNDGNQSGYGVIVYLETSDNNEIMIQNFVDTSGYNIPPQYSDSIPSSHFYKVTDEDSQESKWSGAFLLPFIGPGEIYTIKLLVRTSENPLDLYGSVYNSPLYSPDSVNIGFRYNDGSTYRNNVNQEQDELPFSGCAKCVLEAPGYYWSGCIVTAYDVGMTNAPNLLEVLKWIDGGYISQDQGFDILWDWGSSALSLLYDCSTATLGKIAEWTNKFLSGKALYDNFPESCLWCKDELWDYISDYWEWTGLVELTSPELNIKTGPFGRSSENFISRHPDLFYNINFENGDSLSRTVKEMVITDQLDTALLDLSTFRFSGVGVGGSVLANGIEQKSFIKDYDLRPTRNCILRYKCNLDEQSGIATWRFTSLDPVTLDTLTNAADGFLPPNFESPDGEGFVKYHIKPKKNLPHLTVITNTANITFDDQTSIQTGEWINTIDTLKPESNVLPLPEHIGDTSFTIHFSGNDTHAGILDYRLYVSDNDSAYIYYSANIRRDSLEFNGKHGHQYKFYSIARDRALNIEDPPIDAFGNPDAVTIVDTTISVNEINAMRYNLTLTPNPAHQIVNASFTHNKASNYNIQLQDLTGRLLKNYHGISKPGENRREISLEDISKGIYQILLEMDGSHAAEKLVVD